jgi:hypothetical protein
VACIMGFTSFETLKSLCSGCSAVLKSKVGSALEIGHF